MPPKKKPAKKGNENEPDLLEELTKRFRKAQKENEAPRFPPFDKILAQIEEEGDDIPVWLFQNELDLLNFRLFAESLAGSGYSKFRSLRFFRIPGAGDEIARVLVPFLQSSTCTLEELVISDCNLSPRGCHFLAEALRVNKTVNTVRLDLNAFGSAGAATLFEGIASSASVRALSLAFCDVDAEAARSLNFVLLFVNSRLEDLNLRGNRLGNEGVVQLLSVGLLKTRKLKSLNLACNGLTDSREISSKLVQCIRTNDKLEKYFLTGNQLTDATIGQAVSTIAQNNKHVKFFQIPETCSAAVFEQLETALGAGKKGKKAKKAKKT